MKTVTIRKLQNKTDEVARQGGPVQTPYFARRKASASFKRLDASGKTGRKRDSTLTISGDREDLA